MAVDLRKNKDALTKAYQKVVDDNDDTDWLVLGYEGQTPVLKVVETGNGGIEEMSEELSSGKMMYAYCRVKDPNTGLFKYVLIQWTGESVPENLKLKYTTHTRDIQGFLKGIHVTIPANSEEDIDEADILKRVAKSSGANYGFHKEKAKPEEPPAPVGTDYKRIIPTREIDLNNRDKFWSQAEKEEIDRQKTEKNRAEAERVQLEQERKEREMKEAKEREQRISQRMKEVNQQKQAEKKAFEINREAEKKKWEQVQKESSVDEEERGHRSDQLRKERAAEAAAVVSGSTSSARDFFKQKSVERPDAGANRAPPPPRKIRHGFGNQDSSQAAPAARKAPIELPKAEEAEPVPPSKPMRQPEPEPAPEPQQAYIPEPEPEPEPEPVHEPEPAYEPEPEAVPTSPTSMPQTRDLLRQGLPLRQDSDEEPENDDEAWQEQPAEDFTFREKRVPSYHEDYSAEQHHEETQSHRISSTQHYVEEEETEAPVVSTDQGLRAVALFDYQAADDTEISFDPDDIITNIEQIDEGWWQGFGPDGSYGMFPANYVELC